MTNLVSTVIQTYLLTSMRSPTVRRFTFIPCTHIIYINYVCVVNWTSFCLANSSHILCLMMFVFLGSEFCLQLPSDSTSRWTPLLLANGWQLQAPIVDFHHQVNRHAWRTKKETLSLASNGISHKYLQTQPTQQIT